MENIADKISYDPVDYTALSPGEFASGMMNRMSQDSLESLRKCISDINSLIRSREELNTRLMKDLDKTEIEISNFLNQMSVGDSQAREQMLLFKSKAIEIADAKREEQLECWKDIAKLKEELRGYERELNEKQSRMSMLDSILR